MATASPGLMTCILIVETDSPGWHKSMIKILSVVQGASYKLDAQQGYAYVSGTVDRGNFLKTLAKVGEHIQLYRIDYGCEKNWDKLQIVPGLQDRASHESLPEIKSPTPQDLPTDKNKHNKSSCCTVM